MFTMTTRARKRVLAVAAAAGMTASLSMVGATSAHAQATPTGATGTTVLVIGGPAVNALTASGCGTLTLTGNNGAQVAQTAKNQWRITLAITEVDVNDNGGIGLLHQGSVELQNDCYDITLAALRINNFGEAGQFTSFNLSATLHSPDDSDHYVVGELDLTDAQVAFSGSKVRVTKENLLLAPEGAEEFNELAGNEFGGPFYAGEKIGNGKTTVVFHY